MKTILNVSQPQMGKTTHTLSETETCIEFLNLNMVFEYNITVEDVLNKAEEYSFSTARLDKKFANKLRKNLIIDEDFELPTMLVGIWDVHRAQHVESLLLWAKQRGIPVRMILDEYDVFGVGHETRNEKYASRDESIKMIMDQGLVDILELNSATNISGMISDIHWNNVYPIKPYDGYCGWDTVKIDTLDDSHFHDMLNGVLTQEMKRKLARAYQSNENVLVNLHSQTDKHELIVRAVDGVYDRVKKINYETDEKIFDIPDNNTLIVGGQKFGRSVSIPNLTTCLYFRESLPAAASLLQAVGRVLGPRPFDPLVITTPQLKKSIEQSFRLEQKIIDEEILRQPPADRIKWLNEQVANLDAVRLLTDKTNGVKESKRASYQVTEDVDDFKKFDHWYEIDMPMSLWHDWEIKDSHSTKRSNEMWKICLEKFPHLKDTKGVSDDRDGVNKGNRVRVGIKESNNGYGKYVRSKANYRKYPIMYGVQPGRPGKGFLIVRDPDIEYSEQCWHHNEYGQKMRLVQKQIVK